MAFNRLDEDKEESEDEKSPLSPRSQDSLKTDKARMSGSERSSSDGAEKRNSSLIDRKSSALYEALPEAVAGRGQAGKARFHVNTYDQKSYLIKEDQPETCVLEGSAKFVLYAIPEALQSCIHLATTKTLHDEDGTEKTVTLQKKLDNAQPWDILILGRKRFSKTPISVEAIYQTNITLNINNMSEEARWKFAMALFASNLACDESLHTGQFMATLNESNEITNMTRIDLGARLRYGKKRMEENDFQLQTSKPYASSGQLGKDYISYYLSQPDLRIKYLHIWAQNKENIPEEKIAEASVTSFLDALHEIPQDQQEEALINIYKVIAANSRNEKQAIKVFSAFDLKTKIEFTTEILKEIQITNIRSMRKNARMEISESVKSSCDILDLSDKTKFDIFKIFNWKKANEDITLEKNDNDNANVISELFKKIHKEINNEHPMTREQIHAMQTLLKHLQTSITCQSMYDPEKNLSDELKSLEKLTLQFDLMEKLEQYSEHLPSSAKKSLVEDALRDLITREPTHIITDAFLEAIAEHRDTGFLSFFSPERSKGSLLGDELRPLLSRYAQLTQAPPLEAGAFNPSNFPHQ
ncbi:MAG: hypothetical protein SFW66_04800 [Gammaproteobacteria bacterium]|nr:hypothetical protein [Gammaproteobacteria bacterium]